MEPQDCDTQHLVKTVDWLLANGFSDAVIDIWNVLVGILVRSIPSSESRAEWVDSLSAETRVRCLERLKATWQQLEQRRESETLARHAEYVQDAVTLAWARASLQEYVKSKSAGDALATAQELFMEITGDKDGARYRRLMIDARRRLQSAEE